MYTGDKALLRHIEDSFGNRVVFGYAGAHLREIVDASGRTIRIDWHQGRIINVAVEQGPSFRYDYDAQGRLIRVTDVCGSCDPFECDEQNRMVAMTTKGGVWFICEYSYKRPLHPHDGSGSVVLHGNRIRRRASTHLRQ